MATRQRDELPAGVAPIGAIGHDRHTLMLQSEGFHQLLRRARDGDRAAMDEALVLLRPHLEKIARPYVDSARPSESTSDLIQESCLRAWQKLPTFQGGENDEETYAMFRAWFAQILRRVGLNAARDRKAQRRNPSRPVLRLDDLKRGSTTGGPGMDPPAGDPTPSAGARATAIRASIEAVLAELPEPDPTIARLHFFEGMKFSEIAERLDLPYHQVRNRYLAVSRRLERELEDWR